MTLEEANIGSWYKVKTIHETEQIQRRLEALGILEGTKVEVLNRKRGGATIIRVRGTRWALGKEISQGIEAEEYRHE